MSGSRKKRANSPLFYGFAMLLLFAFVMEVRLLYSHFSKHDARVAAEEHAKGERQADIARSLEKQPPAEAMGLSSTAEKSGGSDKEEGGELGGDAGRGNAVERGHAKDGDGEEGKDEEMKEERVKEESHKEEGGNGGNDAAHEMDGKQQPFKKGGSKDGWKGGKHKKDDGRGGGRGPSAGKERRGKEKGEKDWRGQRGGGKDGGASAVGGKAGGGNGERGNGGGRGKKEGESKEKGGGGGGGSRGRLLLHHISSRFSPSPPFPPKKKFISFCPRAPKVKPLTLLWRPALQILPQSRPLSSPHATSCPTSIPRAAIPASLLS